MFNMISTTILFSFIALSIQLNLHNIMKTNLATNKMTKVTTPTTATSPINLRNMMISTLFGGIALTSGSLPSKAEFQTSPWSDKTQYEVVKSNPSGDQAKTGEMVVVRFRGSYKGIEFDNTFNSDQPYYYRAGVGLIIKGVDDAIMNMHVGDRYKLKFGGDLGFENGKPSKPGSPRIPPKADLDYEVEFVELPGKGDDFIADYE